MRKPLLMICVICCLLFSGMTPLLAAEDWDESWQQNYPIIRDYVSWVPIVKSFLPIVNPWRGTNIFNDGPEPVGSQEDKEEGSEGESDQDTGPESGAVPMTRVDDPTNIGGARGD